MSREHVGHGDIARFGAERVNLSRDKASEYRAQARRLREQLEKFLAEHPGLFTEEDLTIREPRQRNVAE